LRTLALKRDIFYTEEFFKEVLKQFPEIAEKQFTTLLELSNLHKNGGAKERTRKKVFIILI
jgi:hypothetical protein